MKNIVKKLVVVACAAFIFPTVLRAAVPASATQNVPGTMNYQGYLADPSTGNPYVDGIYTLDIRIWNSPTGKSQSNCLWGGKYTAYVKDGYFNIMLGDANASPLNSGVLPTYSNTELWKALWGSTSTDTIRYLGVTPYQSSSHATISSPTEIAPRQQLLSSPFAFRAQHAQYADQAQSTFTVPGKLTVSGGAAFSGSVTLPAGTSVGPIATTTSNVQVGGATTASASLPSIYNVGNYLYLKSYNSMTFAPTAGDIKFTVPSGHSMQVTGAGTFKSDAVNNTIGGTGNTKITGKGNSYIDLTGTSSMKLKTSNSILLDAGAPVNVTGSVVNVRAKSGEMSLESSSSIRMKGTVSTGSWGVIGQGDVGWHDRGVSSSTVRYPFRVYKLTVTIPANGSTQRVDLRSKLGASLWDAYNWVICGSDSSYQKQANVFSVGPTAYAFDESADGDFMVYSTSMDTNERKFKFRLVGIHKAFSGNMQTISVP